MIGHWIAGQHVDRSILLLGHDSHQISSHWSRLSPAQDSLTVLNHGLKHHYSFGVCLGIKSIIGCLVKWKINNVMHQYANVTLYFIYPRKKSSSYLTLISLGHAPALCNIFSRALLKPLADGLLVGY